MSHQSLRFGALFCFLLDGLTQFRDSRVQSIQQLQQIAASPAGPWSQPKRLQLPPSVFPPQPLLTAQSFVQCQGLQLIHDAGAYLHHAVPVPQQLPQIPVLPAWYPNLRKVILQHESQNQLCILSIGLLFEKLTDVNLAVIISLQHLLHLCVYSEDSWRSTSCSLPHSYLLLPSTSLAVVLILLAN